MTHITDSHVACFLPPTTIKESINVYYNHFWGRDILQFKLANGSRDSTKLPPGSWQFLFTTDGCTEEQAKGIVEMTHDTGFGRRFQEFKNYTGKCAYFIAVQSLKSLLRSKGLPEGNYALLF